MMTERQRIRLLMEMATPLLAGELLDRLPDTVFFIKDAEGRYIAVNSTLVERCGKQNKAELIGRTVDAVFPPEMARSYAEQDNRILRGGEPITGKLELHLYPNSRPGWCITTKLPLKDSHGKVLGLAGLSRDLRKPGGSSGIPAALAPALDFINTQYHEQISPTDLARLSGLPTSRFTSLVRKIFHVSPTQLILQTRLQMATIRLRESDDTVGNIAQNCGFYDHSSFSRHFKAATGISPLAYRQACRS